MSPLQSSAYDAIVVGSGPNGLAAAITLARAGWSVQVREAAPTIGGGMRSAESTLPGFIHDICSAFHPLGIGSPFMRSLPLAEHGLEWVHPAAPLAHPFDDGTAALLERSFEATGETLGRDAHAYRWLVEPLARQWNSLGVDVLAPLRIPRHPFEMLGFGLKAFWPASTLARMVFREQRARALFAGLSAHSFLRLDEILTSAFGLMLGTLGHAVGWPFPRGGSQQVGNAMASYLRSLGGEILTNAPVESIDELPPAHAILFDVTPRQLLRIAGKRFPVGFQRTLERYRYGPGVFKVDFALDGPIPWKAPECARGGTVHLGGTLAEIAASERDAVQGRINERPFMLVGQQSLFDPSRAPAGKQTVWAYCHVPNGSDIDMTGRIEAQIERFAPGFKDRILAKHTFSAVTIQQYNANYIGGDINGGVQDWRQLYTRPALRLVPYTTPAKDIYICSSSTPPGGGVHGMCGYFAAQAALRSRKS